MNYVVAAVCVCLVQYCIAQDSTTKLAGSRDFRLRINQAEIEVSPGKNVILSPNIILHTMLYAYITAAQNTQKEIESSLGTNYLNNVLRSVEVTKIGKYSQNSTIFIDQKIESKLNGEEINFANENAPNAVNKWISKETGNRIQQFHYGPFNPKLGALAASASYINSFWKDPFPQANTKKASFYNGKQEITVDFMELEKIVPYYSTNKFQSFGISLEKENQYLYIILPHENENLANLNEELTDKDVYDVIRNSQRTQVHYAIPKLNLKSRQNLKNALQTLGFVRSFIPGVANFNGLTDYEVHVDDITYESILNLYESGIDAASAITMEMAQSNIESHPKSSKLPEEAVQYNTIPKPRLPVPQQITVNRPFIFVLYDNNHHVNLMSGAIYNPQPLYKIN